MAQAEAQQEASVRLGGTFLDTMLASSTHGYPNEQMQWDTAFPAYMHSSLATSRPPPGLEAPQDLKDDGRSDSDSDASLADLEEDVKVVLSKPSGQNLPTKGSTSHHLGACKPCAFFHKEGGCKSGVDCGFCHLCPPGELKLRRKKTPAEKEPDVLAWPAESAWWHQRVLTLSRDSRGCREIQDAIDAGCEGEVLAMSAELRGHISEALRCPNANFVVQKLIKKLPPQSTVFIFEELLHKGPGSVASVARHKYGCRILQGLLCIQLPDHVQQLVDSLLVDAFATCNHPFGNYVMQKLLEVCDVRSRGQLVDILAQQAPHADPALPLVAVYVKALGSCLKEKQVKLSRALLNAPSLLSKMFETRQGHQAARHVLNSLKGAEHDKAKRLLFGRGQKTTNTDHVKMLQQSLGLEDSILEWHLIGASLHPYMLSLPGAIAEAEAQQHGQKHGSDGSGITQWPASTA